MITTYFCRYSQRILNRPAAIKAIGDSCAMNACNSRPFTYSLCFAAKSDATVSPRVLSLLEFCCPNTIIRLVTSFVIQTFNAIKRRWSRTNILQECFKAILPPLADRHASCSVVFKRPVVLVQTAPLYSGPHFIFRATSQPVRSRLTGLLRPETTTTQAFSRREISGKNVLFVSALAAAKPIATSDIRDNSPSRKPFPDQVFCVVMKFHYSLARFIIHIFNCIKISQDVKYEFILG